MSFLVYMGLFTRASIFDTLYDDFDLHWDWDRPALHDSEFTSVGCLDVDFGFNGDSASHAPKASKSSPMCCEAPHHSQWPYSMTESQSMNVHSHIEMAPSESSVKDPSTAVECTEGIVVDDNHGFHAFPAPPKGAEEMVPDNSNFPASPSPPPLSKSGVGYSADYKPISSYERSWNGQRLPSQQNVVSNTTYGSDSVSDNTTRGCRIKRNLIRHKPAIVGTQPTPHSSHTVESSTRIEAPHLHLGSDVRNLRSKRIKACWNNDFVNTFNQDSVLNDSMTRS
ncbi:hypothetical protein RHMOL_Rhmol04G0336400 [Rhododendron molle]|uniref:Uncharacterized protein n=1 Tax=Rhododendron molle TaxID=49168 RepID=A0ACC0P7B2_RHOML|nr:hypothetical protein RHMOL_Rhmol04G0336400 [Rhododendron molle]